MRETDHISDLGWPQNSASWFGFWFHDPLLSPVVEETLPYLRGFEHAPTADGDMLTRDEGPLQNHRIEVYLGFYIAWWGGSFDTSLFLKVPLDKYLHCLNIITESHPLSGGGLYWTETNDSVPKQHSFGRKPTPATGLCKGISSATSTIHNSTGHSNFGARYEINWGFLYDCRAGQVLSLLNPASFPPVQMWILSTILRKLTAQKSLTQSLFPREPRLIKTFVPSLN